MPALPYQKRWSVIAQWCPLQLCVVFFLTLSQVFGSKSAPLNFSRFPAWMCQLMASLFAAAVTHCADDVIAIEPAFLVDSARAAWMCLTETAGWAISSEKSPLPQTIFGAIGVVLDLSPIPASNALVKVTASRLESVTKSIMATLQRNVLSSGEAASLSGKLGFTISATFGRVGRAKIRPICKRAYSSIVR